MNRHRRQLLSLALGVFPWTVFACGDGGALDGLSAGKVGRVTSVRTGDEIEIDGGDVVRLAGVEAPGEGQPYADEAANGLSRLLDGRKVELMFGGARTDPFNHTLAQLRVLETRSWVQGALLDQGAVRVRTFADNRALARPMLAREGRARAAGRGLWALPDYRVLLPEEVDAARPGFAIIEGRVEKTGKLGGGDVYLDFGRDYRDSFSARIPHEAVSAFRAVGLDPLDLQGRLIRVRGALHGWRMTLDHPEQVERMAA